MPEIEHKSQLTINHLVDCINQFHSPKRQLIILDSVRAILKSQMLNRIEICRYTGEAYDNEIKELEQLLHS